MKNRIQRVEEAIKYLPHVRSFGVIGDPGCEGLGTYNMKVYAGALEESGQADMTLIVGDLVPTGTKAYYETICGITETIGKNDVYVLRGNHDTGEYQKYFGRQNYALICNGFAIVVLDNAMRCFEEEGLLLVKKVLALEEVRQAVLAFHIPVPNHFIQNAVSEEEFSKLQASYGPWKEKVAYLLCGHVHSCFVDQVDGIPFICTGGGGAMIEDVSESIRACDVNHHMIHFFMEGEKLCYQFTDIPEACYAGERKNPVIKERLEETVKGELMAHLKYLMFADRARRRGMDKIANLFEALADSEYRHARNFYSVMERPAAFSESVETFIPGEVFEYEHIYKTMADYAKEENAPLTRQAYEGALAAEKVHARLLKEAGDMESFQIDSVYVCPICGYLMTGDGVKERCPVCGGPARQFKEF
ncbi:MAG: ferritin family protein [Lachnoclostridium edouardi]|uniref:ferritin family protein n=1 Tax=Lachnoclostridium edouardi TaxID=1926283 RepID=UPI0026DAF4D4|nr:ferritin family protein [Lachnoclostridium edouardi]MDO4278011.1 ferritin family protein [Lachnoclostridium edouardi]